MLGRILMIGLLLMASGRLLQAQPPQPRVLLLGDQIYQQPASELAKALQGKAEVVYVRLQPGEIFHSSFLLANLDRFLGDGRWDLIHFNVGLGDLIHRAPGMRSFRVLPPQSGGVRATPPELYRSNLKSITDRLQATGARVVWASTTPIRHSGTEVFITGSEVEYNQIAAEVMKSRGVPINDMHAYVKDLIDMDRPAGHNADPFHFDRKPIHGPVLDSIERFLDQSGSAPHPVDQSNPDS